MRNRQMTKRTERAEKANGKIPLKEFANKELFRTQAHGVKAGTEEKVERPAKFDPSNNHRFLDDLQSPAATGAHAGKGPKGYYRSDERITEEVSEALAKHSEIDASEIEVNVEQGVITFSGEVESRQIKRLVEDLVEGMTGVTDIKNELSYKAALKNSGNKDENTQQRKRSK